MEIKLSDFNQVQQWGIQFEVQNRNDNIVTENLRIEARNKELQAQSILNDTPFVPLPLTPEVTVDSLLRSILVNEADRLAFRLKEHQAEQAKKRFDQVPPEVQAQVMTLLEVPPAIRE